MAKWLVVSLFFLTLSLSENVSAQVSNVPGNGLSRSTIKSANRMAPRRYMVTFNSNGSGTAMTRKVQRFYNPRSGAIIYVNRDQSATDNARAQLKRPANQE